MRFNEKSSKGKMIRAGVFPIEDVLPYVVFDETLRVLKKEGVKRNTPEWIDVAEKSFEGHMVKMHSQRYQLFASKGVICVECGLAGKFFALESHSYKSGVRRFHLNLYGILPGGKERLMTKDHIIPKSKGGRNHMDNYQTMCTVCNREKGDNLEEQKRKDE